MKTLYVLPFVTLFLGCSQPQDKSVAPSYSSDTSTKAFSHAIDLSHEEQDKFMLGKSFFSVPWVEAPSATTARDGLGPLFSANTCKHCHPNNSAGVAITEEGKVARSLVLRLSNAKNINNDLIMKNGFMPEPTYGGQLSVSGTSDVPYEGSVSVKYEEIHGMYTDKEPYMLRLPLYSVENVAYGAMREETNIAPRVALSLVGMGLLEAVSDAEILKYEDRDDANKDGISGKANYVFSPEHNKTMLGRFAYKATAVDIKHQSANAAHNDMGLSNPLYPYENCTQAQKECNEAPRGVHEFDLPQERLEAIAFYLKARKIPAPRVSEAYKEGKEIFSALGCVACHRESMQTPDGIVFYPYSDLLLHDMGEGLADGHSDFLASKSEFRTTPLWGIGLREKLSGSLQLLHDGRARSFEEAILWHGGEAQNAKEAFVALDKEKRERLVAFLKGL